MPLNIATKAFSYNLARFGASFCCKLYNILLSHMRISQNLIHFRYFSLLLLSFFLPFCFLYLLLFIPFLSTGNVLASALQKNLEMKHWSIRWLGIFHHKFCTKIGHVFSGIALPEFDRYSKCKSGSMSPPSNDPKIRLFTGKS